MSSRAPWKQLGIAPTSDVRLIRSAYAAKLKLIDVDADPASFQALRALHDRALQLANNIRTKESGQIVVAHEESAEFDEECALESQPAPSADAPSPFAELDNLRQQIWDMLVVADANPWSANNLAAVTQRLLALPVLDRIDVADDTERWFAAVASENIPRSDPIIDMLIDHYSWRQLEGSINDFYGLANVLQRQTDMACSAGLRSPRHEWHQIFCYLQGQPADVMDAKEKKRMGKQVSRLLDSIRFHNPTVEVELNHRHVAVWDQYLADAAQTKIEARKKIPFADKLPDLTVVQWIGFAFFLFSLINFIASKL
ncbi:MAG: hypothetical protein SFV20_02640 [Sphingopyxis sp.]|nr:hypothetical protein [Sphingopyxis sp.]